MARSSAQSFQRYPLTVVLGSTANVRVLRELSRHGGLLSAPCLVSRSGLSSSSVHAALYRLEASDIVDRVGSGRVHLYRVRAQHPLVIALESLFEAEGLLSSAELAAKPSTA